MEVCEVDPRDDEAFAAWFEVVAATGEHDRPGEPDWLPVEQRALSLHGTGDDPDVRCLLLAVREGDRTVGAARMEVPQRDNDHLVEMLLAVHPDARRRGVGRALVDEMDRRTRELGRTTLLTYADEPAGPSVNRRAGQALGYAVVQEEVRRDIDLPLDPARVEALREVCRLHAADYDVRLWWDRCPDELVDDRALLGGAMSTDVPKDGMDWREEVWDAARLRRKEQESSDMDRTTVSAGAVHVASGRMVAYTEMGVPRTSPSRVYQWDTLVRESHRGHRLGLLVKLAALQELHAKVPAAQFISTWNAQENAPMIAVNDALGARTNGRVLCMQRVLE